MYTDARFVDAYSSTGPLDRKELAHVPGFFAFEMRIQAWYGEVRVKISGTIRGHARGCPRRWGRATGPAQPPGDVLCDPPAACAKSRIVAAPLAGGDRRTIAPA